MGFNGHLFKNAYFVFNESLLQNDDGLHQSFWFYLNPVSLTQVNTKEACCFLIWVSFISHNQKIHPGWFRSDPLSVLRSLSQGTHQAHRQA